MKKQSTPVQGYDTQSQPPRAAAKRGASKPTAKPVVKTAPTVHEPASTGTLDNIPISELNSGLVTGGAKSGGDIS